jgi:L-fuculose-phosphate aldolase
MCEKCEYTPLQTAKEMICEIGRRMYTKNFAAGNDGNISCRLSSAEVVCTPTGVSKGFMMPDMMSVVGMDGIQRFGPEVSSEVKMHLRVYRDNESIMAVIHAHPPVATSFAVAGIPLDKAILAEVVTTLGIVPVAPFATPGTDEVQDSIGPYLKDYNAVLLANHGALTWGKSLMEAWFRMERLEHYAKIMMYTSSVIGKANALTSEQIDRLILLNNDETGRIK